MNSLDKLTEAFKSFPGIGPRQAKRFSYYLLTRNRAFLQELSKAILSIQDEIQTCKHCYKFFSKPVSGDMVCSICSSKNRDHSLLMVVSRDSDLENVESTNSYNGLYFVLGGGVPILEKKPETRIRISELLEKVQNSSDIKEIILATNANPEGENTADYVRHKLRPLIEGNDIRITTLGRGMSTGTELEYSDADTLKGALRNRL